MAQINVLSTNVIDSILPVFGQPRVNQPIWDETRRMFIADEFESRAGNRSYKGVRVSDRFIIVEQIGNYHNWTYINSIEMYAFDGKERLLIGKKDFKNEPYDANFVRETTEKMLVDFMKSQLKMQQRTLSEDQLITQAKAFIDRSYCSMLDDKSQILLEAAKPLLR